MSGVQPEILSDVANSILVNAEACFESCGIDVPTEVFVSHMKPPDDCCDWMAVWVRDIVPVNPFPRVQTNINPNCTEVSMGVLMSLGWKRDCYPTVKDDKTDPFPGGDVMQAAADALLIEARTMWCCILAAYTAGQLLPRDPEPDGPQPDIVWGKMTPNRGGGCAGWTWDFTLEVPACCWDAPPLPGSGSGS
ncbi:MAG TPA: hypothetical protein VM487_19135 [Phycisphaerae bacterium]|nr:hypothetical protein [Phycisphaerae bacterium]